MIDRTPFSAPAWPPDTGASTNAAPRDPTSALSSRAKAADAHFLATLGRHVNDNMCSVYILAPGGIAVEYGYDGLLIDHENHIATVSYEGDLWGHEYNFPGVN